jgi:4-amino-4-deoxy-L-arabinose transferase-like glycosyltransferase
MYNIPRAFSIASFIGLLVVYLVGLLVPDLMEVDASQYASISMEMASTNSFLEVFHLENNYLDKPPLLFWLGAIFIKLFGVNHFAYRLPTLLSSILGVYATYKLGKRLYNRNTGIISALLIASSQVYILHNHDVRTDTLLTNFVIVAIWQGVAYLQTKKTIHFIWAFVSVGLAMTAKGPIGAVVPVMAIGTHLLYQRDWRNIFNWRWIIGILIVLVVLSPMLWGLYTQFDLNSTAQVNGRVGVSGLRFFFWEQSFGRITGENVWKDDSSYFFFTHNYLWEFLPWSLIGIFGFWDKIKQMIQTKFQPTDIELYTFGGFILPFIALSTSHYKLPHYIMVIMPMAAIFTAAFMDKLLKKSNAQPYITFKWVQLVFSVLIGFLVLFILYWVFPATHAIWWLIPLGIFGFISFSMIKSNPAVRLLGPSIVAVIGTNIMMNGYFYPQMNQYQSGRVTADWILENNIDFDDFITYGKHYHVINFYSKEYKIHWAGLDYIQKRTETKDLYLFTHEDGVKSLKNSNMTYEIVKNLYNFPNTELTGEFLNPKTREKALEKMFIVKVEKKK